MKLSGKVLAFLKGVGSIVNIFGVRTKPKPIKLGSIKDDIEAIRGDYKKAYEKTKHIKGTKEVYEDCMKTLDKLERTENGH